MKFSSSLITASALVAFPLTDAASLYRRAFCDTINTSISGATNGPALAQAYCKQRLGIKDIISTSTTTLVTTKTSTGQTTTTTVNTVTPATIVGTLSKTTTTFATVTPATVTAQATVTSTAYLDIDGATFFIAKRDAAATPGALDEVEDAYEELEKRAIAPPAFFASLTNSQLTAACQCLNIQPATVVRSAKATTTTTVAALRTYTAKAVTTIAAPKTTTTKIGTKIITVTAPAPIVTAVSTFFQQLTDTCPASWGAQPVCPEDTSADDGSLTSQGQLACSVVADDNYQGYCVYWSDDGSPSPSTLTLQGADSSATSESTRDAVYGNDTSDDCPAWSDFVCSADPVTFANPHTAKRRWLEENEKSASHDDIRSTLTARRVLRQRPDGLKRGGKIHAPKVQS